MADPARPLVSAVIPAYNAAGTIDRAIKSALSQTYPAIEILVADDCSTDGTRERVARYSGDKVRLLRLRKNSGASAARNAAIAEAAGTYVAFLDADDEWMRNKIELQVAAAVTRSNLAFVTCDAVVSEMEGRSVRRLFDDCAPAEGLDAWRTLLRYSFVATPCVLAPRARLIELGGFNPSLPVAEDQDLWIRLANSGEVIALKESLVVIHGTQSSLMGRTPRAALDYLLPVIETHLRDHWCQLSVSERRAIRRTRLGEVGRNLLLNGCYARGLGYLARAVALGDRPLQNLIFPILTVPMVQALIRRSRIRSAHS